MHKRSRSQASLAGTIAAVALAIGSSLGASDAPAQSGKPIINVATVILAEPAVETPLPIQIGPTDAIPQQTFLRIRGLPGSASLSEGHSIAAGAWAIPLSGLARLKILTPIGSPNKSEITISLVAIDGRVLSEVKSTLLVAPAALIAPAGREAAPAQPSASTASLGPPPAALPAPASRLQLDARPAPPVPPGPQLGAEDRERAHKLMQRGDESMIVGNVAVGRPVYRRAAELDWGPGALALAATYDPNELSRWNVLGGVQADRETALKWYEKARELGVAEAAERLQRLGTAPR